MADVVMDTTDFEDVKNGNVSATRLLDRLQRSAARIYYSPITVFELWLRMMLPLEEARHLAVLASCDEAPFDQHAARIMALWLRGHPRSGRRRLLGDAMIAATAASLGATIYIRNPRDFTRFYTDVQSY